MKVTFEELKAAFNRVLLDRGVKRIPQTPAPRCSPAPRSPAFIHTASTASRDLFSSLTQATSSLTPSRNA